MNYKENFIDNLFVEIGNIITELRYKAQSNRNNLINRFLDYAVNLAQSETEDEIIEMELQYKINRICIKKDIDDEIVKCLFIIKALIYSIVDRDYDKVLMFAKKYAGEDIFKDLSYKLCESLEKKAISSN